MTAPAPRPDPDVAGRLAEALTEALERLGLDDMTEHEDRLDVAQALLLPVVDAIAAERAAEERQRAWRDGWESAKAFLLAPVVFRSDEDAAALRGEGRG